MFTIIRKRCVASRLISLVTTSFFFLSIFSSDVLAITNPSASTLGTLPASKNPISKREITASMYRASRLIWLAQSPRYLDLLARYNALALLLPSGRYLMSPETAANDLALIRSTAHEDNEVLMQQEEKLNATRHNRLMRLILGRDNIMRLYYTLSHYKEPKKEPHNIVFNDLISKAFEILFIIDEGLVYSDELTSQEREFVTLMRPILQAKDSLGRYKNFSQVFFDTDKRTKAIKALQENTDERFYRVANTEETEDVSIPSESDNAEQNIQEIPKESKGFVSPQEARGVIKQVGKVLTFEEEQILFRALHSSWEEKDERIKQEVIDCLVMKNQGLIAQTVQELHMQAVQDDAMQDGNIGLLKAIDRFDYSRGFKFATYAKWWIKQVLHRDTRDLTQEIRIPVHIRSRMAKLMKAMSSLTGELGRDPTTEEIAKKLGISEKDVIALFDIRKLSPASLDKKIGEDEDSQLYDMVAGEVGVPFKENLGDLLTCLTFPERIIIKMRNGIGTARGDYSLDEIANILDLTRERVRQIEANAIKTLQRAARDKRIRPKAITPVDSDHLDVYLVETFKINPRSPLFKRFYSKGVEGRDRWLKNVREIIAKERPDIMEIYKKHKSLAPAEQELLRQSIYKITHRHFVVWKLSGSNSWVPLFYAAKNYYQVLMVVFPDIGLSPLGFKLNWSSKREALQSIHFILSREAPDLLKRYNNLKKLNEAQIKDLKDDIYRIDSARLEAWGLRSVFNRRTAPYFYGRYVEALQEVFSKLNLDPLGFQLDWSTDKRGIDSVRFVLSKEAPSIIERYNRLSELNKHEKEVLRRDVYSITSVHFKLWNLNSAMDMNRAPYFKGSYIDVLLAVFPDLALDRLGFQLNWSTQETGFASLRFVLSKEIPSIIERYDRINELGEEAKRQLKEDIYKINGALVKQWNIESGIHRQFKGSYIVALIALFPKLNLDPLGFRLDWSTKERALESIRFVLHREIPHIMEKYDNLKNLDEEGKKLLAEEIYELRAGDFQAWNLSNVYHKTQASYFNGSYIDALIAVFPELSLERFGFELDWSSREKALDSIRFVLKKEIPDIMERYEALDRLDLTQLSRLRNDIYAITNFHLNAWKLSSTRRPEVVKYFGKNYISVLLNVFDHPRLGLSEEGFVTYRKGHTEKKYFWMDGIEAGIQNVRDAILNNRPDIVERYDNLERLTDAEIELLKRDIYRINSGYFRAWGLTRATIRSSAPYFEGSYIKALQATFPALNLNSLEFRLDWSSKEKAVESILYVLSKKVQHIVKEYQKFDSLDEAEKKALRKEIYNINAGHFASWGLNVAMDKRKIGYFNGSYIEALRVVFQRLDLNPLGFILDWSTKEKTIESIRFILSNEAPDIIERYDSLDKLNENEIEALKNDIYTLTRAKLKFWGLESIFLRQAVPFFNGNRTETFMAVFSRLNLDPLGFGLDWSTRERSIDSMRFVLSRQAPSIIESYKKLDRSDATQKRMIRNDIYRISLGHFEIWGLAEALNMQQVPYFGGSYIKALCAVFPDIGLDPLGFQLDWTTRKRAIESIHFVLRKEVPHIMDSYDQIEKLNEAEKEKMRRDIYNITNTHFKLWGLSNALDGSKVPFFKGSYKYALIMAFRKLRLEPYGFQLDWASRQKAIKSIRFVLTRECPLIVTRYDRFGTLDTKEIEELREKIYAITSDHFEVWGLKAVSAKTTVPYFDGSYIKALQAVFPKLQLNSLDFKLEFITPEKAVKSIRHILFKKAPDIVQRYGKLDSLTNDEIEKLKEDVYKISSKDLQEWGCISALKNVPYFEGNYIKVLQAAFPKLKLDPIGFSLDWTTRKNAIASVRCVIKQKAPDIIVRYNKLEELTNDEIEELKNDIYAIGEKTFLEWGLSGYKRAPYFKGRYSKTLQAVFPKLKLNMLGFRLDWTNRARAIASIRYVLKRKRPDIIDRYERRNSLSPDEMLGLKDDIYRLNSKTLIEWGLSHAFNMPYFKGGVCFIMQTMFPDLSLEPLGFNLDWTTKERATESVRFVLKRQIPNIYGKYEKLSSLAPDQVEILKQEIYTISQGDLRKWGLIAALSVPEFKGHYFYVLQAIFAELNLDDRGFKSKNLPDKTPPAGSIYIIFKYLCDKDITVIDRAISGENLAKYAGEENEARQEALSFESIEDDLRGLLLHLHLIEKAPGSETGKNARYYVPEAVKKKSAEILPHLEQFRGEDLRPDVALLDQVFEAKIKPILESLFQNADTVQQAFNTLNSETRKESQLSASVSKLRGTSQNLMEVNKFKFCLPIEVLRNSPDIALALNSTGLLKQRPQDAENIEFELVVTGVTDVTDEDIKLIEGLNRDDIKKALNLPKKFTVSVITEAQIQETAQRFGYDASNPKNRVAIVKDFFSGALAKGEYMAIATDAVDTTEKADSLKEALETELKAELAQENISIRVLVRPESGKSMYSLSKIINDWLEAINQGNFSTISRILPIPAPLTPELERAIKTAWAVLTAA